MSCAHNTWWVSVFFLSFWILDQICSQLWIQIWIKFGIWIKFATPKGAFPMVSAPNSPQEKTSPSSLSLPFVFFRSLLNSWIQDFDAGILFSMQGRGWLRRKWINWWLGRKMPTAASTTKVGETPGRLYWHIPKKVQIHGKPGATFPNFSPIRSL